MAKYEKIVKYISVGDKVQIETSKKEYSGTVLSMDEDELEISRDEGGVAVVSIKTIDSFEVLQSPKNEVESIPPTQSQTQIQVQPQAKSQIPNQTQKPEVIIHTEIHGYRLLSLDQFQDSVMLAVKEGKYKNKNLINSFLQSFEHAKKNHEDQIGQHKMDDILAKIRREIVKNPSDNFLVELLGTLLHHCGRDDMAEEEFNRIHRMTSEKKSKSGDPSYVTRDMEFVGSVYKFNTGTFNPNDLRKLKPGDVARVSSYGFITGKSVEDPKKIIGNLYFNLYQVSDPEFRRLLLARNFRHKRIRFKIGTSIKGIDPYPAADDIRLLRYEGWIQSFEFRVGEHYENAGKISDYQGQLQTFNLTNVSDPILRAYLESRGTITSDDDEIQVTYILRETTSDRLQVEGIVATREFSQAEINRLKSAGYLSEIDLENWRTWRRNNLTDMNIDENYKPLPPFSGKLPDEVVSDRMSFIRDPWLHYEPDTSTHEEDPYSQERYQDWIIQNQIENAPKFDPEKLYDQIYFSLYGEMQNIALVVPPACDKSKIDSLVNRICSRLQEISEDPDEKLQLLQFDFINANESFENFSKRILQFRRSGFDGNIFVIVNSFTGEKIDSSGIKFILEKSAEENVCFFIIFTRQPIDSRFKDRFEFIEI